jgi:hypothetical protein|tara:strand:+ start:253 stop:597 length:345 start_codon:yes stop_codon:yes gene_type:complete
VSPKKLEPNSSYNRYDADGDGVVSDEEIESSERLQQLEVLHEKADAQKNMCWLALLGMLLYPSLVVISDLLGLSKAADVLGDMSSIYFVSVGGLISVWFSAQAYTNAKNNGGDK